MERLEPKMSVDDAGNIIWVPSHVDYDPSIFFRGKKVTDKEFNGLFLKQAYQSNHTADSLSTFLDKHLGVAIHRRFVSSFNLAPSYVKTFTPTLWGTLQPDGYYYINIPASEHGFPPNEIDEGGELSKVSIAAEMSLMSDTGQFYTVPQVEIDAENNVRVYTDDNTVAGFVIIRRSDKAFAVAAAIVDATQIQGLAPVAVSARYTDLVDIDSETGPNTRIAANAADITKIINGEYTVGKALKSESAEYADYTKGLLLDSTIQGIPVSNIFEEGSSYVKNATVAQYADLDKSKGTIAERLDNLGFKEGSTSSGAIIFDSEITRLQLLDTTKSSISATRQGNYVILTLKLSYGNGGIGAVSLLTGGAGRRLAYFSNTLADGRHTYKELFAPKIDTPFAISAAPKVILFPASGDDIDTQLNLGKGAYVYTNGEIATIDTPKHSFSAGMSVSGLVLHTDTICIGYEANPID